MEFSYQSNNIAKWKEEGRIYYLYYQGCLSPYKHLGNKLDYPQIKVFYLTY